MLKARWDALIFLPDEIHFRQFSAVDRFCHTFVFALREPAINGCLADAADLGYLNMRDIPASVKGLRGHAKLATAIQLKKFEFPLS